MKRRTKILINFPTLDPDSPEFKKMKQMIKDWSDTKKTAFALTTAEMKVYRFSKGEEIELVDRKKKQKKRDFWDKFFGI